MIFLITYPNLSERTGEADCFKADWKNSAKVFFVAMTHVLFAACLQKVRSPMERFFASLTQP